MINLSSFTNSLSPFILLTWISYLFFPFHPFLPLLISASPSLLRDSLTPSLPIYSPCLTLLPSLLLTLTPCLACLPFLFHAQLLVSHTSYLHFLFLPFFIPALPSLHYCFTLLSCCLPLPLSSIFTPLLSFLSQCLPSFVFTLLLVHCLSSSFSFVLLSFIF